MAFIAVFALDHNFYTYIMSFKDIRDYFSPLVEKERYAEYNLKMEVMGNRSNDEEDKISTHDAYYTRLKPKKNPKLLKDLIVDKDMENHFPVSFKEFVQYTNISEIVKSDIKSSKKHLAEEYLNDKVYMDRMTHKCYLNFYIKYKLRKIPALMYVKAREECPPGMKERIFEIPEQLRKRHRRRRRNDNNNDVADAETDDCHIGEVTKSKSENTDVLIVPHNPVNTVTCFKDSSTEPSLMPPSFALFKKFINFKEDFKCYITRLSQGDTSRAKIYENDENLRKEFELIFYKKFYTTPDVRKSLKWKLRPCPRPIKEQILTQTPLVSFGESDELPSVSNCATISDELPSISNCATISDELPSVSNCATISQTEIDNAQTRRRKRKRSKILSSQESSLKLNSPSESEGEKSTSKQSHVEENSLSESRRKEPTSKQSHIEENSSSESKGEEPTFEQSYVNMEVAKDAVEQSCSFENNDFFTQYDATGSSVAHTSEDKPISNFKYPVSLETFKVYTYYEEIVDEIFENIPDKSKYSKEIESDEEKKNRILCAIYQAFYRSPEFRNKYKIKLKPCPRHIKDLILKLPEKLTDAVAVEKKDDTESGKKLPSSIKRSSIKINNAQTPKRIELKALSSEQNSFTEDSPLDSKYDKTTSIKPPEDKHRNFIIHNVDKSLKEIKERQINLILDLIKEVVIPDLASVSDSDFLEAKFEALAAAGQQLNRKTTETAIESNEETVYNKAGEKRKYQEKIATQSGEKVNRSVANSFSDMAAKSIKDVLEENNETEKENIWESKSVVAVEKQFNKRATEAAVEKPEEACARTRGNLNCETELVPRLGKKKNSSPKIGNTQAPRCKRLRVLSSEENSLEENSPLEPERVEPPLKQPHLNMEVAKDAIEKSYSFKNKEFITQYIDKRLSKIFKGERYFICDLTKEVINKSSVSPTDINAASVSNSDTLQETADNENNLTTEGRQLNTKTTGTVTERPEEAICAQTAQNCNCPADTVARTEEKINMSKENSSSKLEAKSMEAAVCSECETGVDLQQSHANSREALLVSEETAKRTLEIIELVQSSGNATQEVSHLRENSANYSDFLENKFFIDVDKNFTLAYAVRRSRGLKRRIIRALMAMNRQEFSKYTRIHGCGENIYQNNDTLDKCYQFVMVEQQIWPPVLYMRSQDMMKYLFAKGLVLEVLNFENISPKFLDLEELARETNIDQIVVQDYFKETGKKLGDELLPERRQDFYERCWAHDEWLRQVPTWSEDHIIVCKGFLEDRTSKSGQKQKLKLSMCELSTSILSLSGTQIPTNDLDKATYANDMRYAKVKKDHSYHKPILDDAKKDSRVTQTESSKTPLPLSPNIFMPSSGSTTATPPDSQPQPPDSTQRRVHSSLSKVKTIGTSKNHSSTINHSIANMTNTQARHNDLYSNQQNSKNHYKQLGQALEYVIQNSPTTDDLPIPTDPLVNSQSADTVSSKLCKKDKSIQRVVKTMAPTKYQKEVGRIEFDQSKFIKSQDDMKRIEQKITECGTAEEVQEKQSEISAIVQVKQEVELPNDLQFCEEDSCDTIKVYALTPEVLTIESETDLESERNLIDAFMNPTKKIPLPKSQHSISSTIHNDDVSMSQFCEAQTLPSSLETNAETEGDPCNTLVPMSAAVSNDEGFTVTFCNAQRVSHTSSMEVNQLTQEGYKAVGQDGNSDKESSSVPNPI